MPDKLLDRLEERKLNKQLDMPSLWEAVLVPALDSMTLVIRPKKNVALRILGEEEDAQLPAGLVELVERVLASRGL